MRSTPNSRHSTSGHRRPGAPPLSRRLSGFGGVSVKAQVTLGEPRKPNIRKTCTDRLTRSFCLPLDFPPPQPVRFRPPSIQVGTRMPPQVASGTNPNSSGFR